ncbi:MAG: hypothetical protein ACE5D3_01270, partial [Candidatus Binatia bacterium]
MTTRRLASLVFGLVVTISLGLAATPAGAQVIEVPPFRLGPPIIGHLQDVDVSFGDDGTLVYVWGEYDLRPPFRNENDHVVSQWFSVDGVAIKPPVVVDTSGGVFNPVIHSDLRGGHLASWLWIGNRIYRVRTRSVNAGGRGGAAGPDFQADRNGLGPAGFSTFALGLPDGFAYVWNQNGMRLRTFFANGRPRGIDQKFSRGGYRLDGAVLPDGGFITVWSFGANGRIFDGDGTPRTDNFVFSDTVSVTRVATSPAGDIAALGTHQDETSLDVVVVRLASDGTPMREFTVVSIPDAAPGNPFIYADLDFDHYGNLLVVTTISDNDVAEANVAPTVRAYAPDDTLLGPPLTLSSMLG